MAGSRNGPSEALVFVIVVMGLLIFAMVFGSTDDGSKRSEYRLHECVTNLEQMAMRQEEIRQATGRYLSCPSFPDEVPGDEPVLWKVPCAPDGSSAEEDDLPRARCRGAEVCEKGKGCIDPESSRTGTAVLIPTCWGLLMGLDRDTMIRGQYRSEAPFTVSGRAGARFEISCRTDLTGEGTVTQYVATESKTTWMDKEIAR
jgi:hypothetical protein